MTRDQKNKLKQILFNRLEWDMNQGDPGLFDLFLKQYNFQKCWHVQKSTEDFFSHYWIDLEGNKVRSGKTNFILPLPVGYSDTSFICRKYEVLVLEQGFKMSRELALRVLILGYIP